MMLIRTQCRAIPAAVVLLCALLSMSNAAATRWPGEQPTQVSRPSRALLQTDSTRYHKPWLICTSDWMPMVLCNNLQPSEFIGYQIDLWRDIAADMGLTEDVDWSFTCMDWDVMIDDLIHPQGNCTFAAAGVEVSMINILAGIKFSWPFYKSGLQVMVSSHLSKPGTWSFFQVFHWSVWVMYVGSGLFVMLVINLVEVFSTGGLRKLQSNTANRKGIRNWSWYIAGQMVNFQTHVGDPKTWGSRVLVLGWAFLVLILVHLFTAQTANKMTTERLANSISGPEDLPGKAVESWAPYVPILRRYRINADAVPWNNPADEKAMLAKLRGHEYAAIVLDQPAIQAFAARAPACDLFPVGEIFDSFGLALAYPPDVPLDMAANISAWLVRLQHHTAILDQLDNKYIHGGTTLYGASACANAFSNTAADHGGSNPQIQFSEVLGLWYILAGAFGTALLLTAYKRWRGHNRVLNTFDSFVSGSGYGGGSVAGHIGRTGLQGSGPSFLADTYGSTHGLKKSLESKPSRLKDSGPGVAQLLVVAESSGDTLRGAAQLTSPVKVSQQMTPGESASNDGSLNHVLKLSQEGGQ